MYVHFTRWTQKWSWSSGISAPTHVWAPGLTLTLITDTWLSPTPCSLYFQMYRWCYIPCIVLVGRKTHQSSRYIAQTEQNYVSTQILPDGCRRLVTVESVVKRVVLLKYWLWTVNALGSILNFYDNCEKLRAWKKHLSAPYGYELCIPARQKVLQEKRRLYEH